MTNPRKFADKLEIIRRKEEEANAAFDKIMQEVSDARMGISPPLTTISSHYTQGHMMRSPNADFIKMRQKYKGGSLPNVNTSLNPMNFQNSFPGLNEPYNNHQNGYPGPIFPTKTKRSYTVSAPYRTNSLQPAAAIAEQGDGVQLWRRTFSDSAIQQALQQLPKKANTSPQMQHRTSSNNGPRLIQTPTQSIKNENDVQTFNNSMKVNFNDKTKSQNSVQMQANTSSLPDLSNLSIPSPIQTPLDNEQESKLNIDEQRNPFQAPYNLAPRRPVGKQVYRGMSPNSDVLETFHRDQKNRINLYPNLGKNEVTMTGGPISRSAPGPTPLSPVASQPFYWNNQTLSPLVANDMIASQQSLQNDLQQQLQQFQMQAESPNISGIQNQSAYLFDGRDNGYDLYYSNNQYPNKSTIFRQNLGQLGNNNNVCGRTLDFMKFKNQNELSEADLNSVGVTLDPLDLRILSDDSTELVDQSAEEQFRLERANYQ